MTRLPTLTPVSPFSKPGITPLPPMVKLNGRPAEDDEGQVELNTAPVRQIEATYWATTVCLAVTTGPVPWISVLVTRPVGGAVFGTVITGAAPAACLTVGRPLPPDDRVVPVAEAVGANGWIRSMTHTVASVLVTPSWDLPVVPEPYLGGRTATI